MSVLVVLLFLGPALALLLLVALPRRAGLALALLLAVGAAAGALVHSALGTVDATSVDLTLPAALFWGGAAVVAGALQAVRPALSKPCGRPSGGSDGPPIRWPWARPSSCGSSRAGAALRAAEPAARVASVAPELPPEAVWCGDRACELIGRAPLPRQNLRGR